MMARSMFSEIARSASSQFMPHPGTPITFNFDQGSPEPETFPINDYMQLHGEVLDRDGGLAMEYITIGLDTESEKYLYLSDWREIIYGNRDLRGEVAKWIAGKDNRPDLNANNVILTLGSAQAIALAINAFVDADEGVLVEAQSYPHALRFMKMRHAKVRPVAMDGDGMNTEDLERNLFQMREEGIRPKMIYIVSTFSCPTGLTTSVERRRRILELGDEYDLVIVEDAVYSDLRYSGEAVPSLLSLDSSGRVMQSHSFSKILAPGVRIGWMTGTEDMIEGLAIVKQDLGVSQLTARVMAEYMRRGLIGPHLERVKSVYRRKRDVAAKAVTTYCAPYVKFSLPDGGFFLWLELSDKVDWGKAAAAVAERGVWARPGERFMNEGSTKGAGRYLRLAFSHAGDDEIERGIAELGAAIRDAVPTGTIV